MSAPNSSNSSQSDWARIDAIPDSQIDTSDVPPLGPSYFARAQLRPPTTRVHIEIPIDTNLLAWFKALGPGWEHRINAALRVYVEAHEHYERTNHTTSPHPDTSKVSSST